LKKLRLSNQAREFILSEIRYLKKYSPPASARFRNDIDKSLRALSRYSDIGRLDQSYPVAGVRRIVAGDYVVYYAVSTDIVDVLHVRHGRQSEPWVDFGDDEDFEA